MTFFLLKLIFTDRFSVLVRITIWPKANISAVINVPSALIPLNKNIKNNESDNALKITINFLAKFF